MTVNGQLSADVTSSVVQTTDGSTTVTIYSTTAFLANDGGQLVTFDICGFDFNNDEVATAKIVVKLKNIGGTATIVGTPIHLVPISAGSSSGLVTAAIDVVIDGSNLKVHAIGVTGRTIDWTVNRFPSLSVLDSWTAVPTPEDGYVQKWIAARSRWEPVSVNVAYGTVNGDLYGTLPNPTVISVTGDITTNPPITSIRLGYAHAYAPGEEIRIGPPDRSTFGETVLIHGQDNLVGAYGSSSGGDLNIRAGNTVSGIGGNLRLDAGECQTGAGNARGNIYIGGNTTVEPPIIALRGESLTLAFPTATSATTGSNGDVPGQVVGYLKFTLTNGGTVYKIPYYNT